MNLALIGLRGAGKSAIGRLVADRTGREFIDLDDLTPQILGSLSVREAWMTYGEESFRRAETVALAKALSGEDFIVALGGGTPTAPLVPDLIEHERASGRLVVVYLAASAKTLRSRLKTSDNTHRPSLTGKDPLDEIEDVLAARDPLYRRIADAVIETDELDSQLLVAQVSSLLGG